MSQQDESARISQRIRQLLGELGELLDEEARLLGVGRVELQALKDECAELKRKGLPIEAVRLYRAKTGLTLIEAREAVAQLK